MSKKRSLEDYGIRVTKKERYESPSPTIIIDTNGCKVIYIKHFLSAEEETTLMEEMKNTEFEKEIIRMYGKEMVAPRETFSYGDDGMSYTYAGKTEKSIGWSSAMHKLKDKVHHKSQEYGDVHKSFNFALINKYRDGNDYIGLHSDSEKDIIPRSTIASLSLGASRTFCFVENETKQKVSILLESGSLLLMTGETQSRYKHQLLKSKLETRGRYNFTFRHLHTPK